jgi:hypothetical protein
MEDQPPIDQMGDQRKRQFALQVGDRIETKLGGILQNFHGKWENGKMGKWMEWGFEILGVPVSAMVSPTSCWNLDKKWSRLGAQIAHK